MLQKLKRLYDSSKKLKAFSTDQKNHLLDEISLCLLEHKQQILQANSIDVDLAMQQLQDNQISESFVNRLKLNHQKVEQFQSYAAAVKKLADPVGKVVDECLLDNNLHLIKVTEALGVLAIIFESRPEVVVQASVLALKSGNGAVLKGGQEAANSNRLLFDLIRGCLQKYGLEDCLLLIEGRAAVDELLNFNQYIDLIIPRGSNSFVNFIQKNTTIPVLGHSAGVCHAYIAEDAPLDKALDVVIDSKCDYPAACNALETLLLDSKIASSFLDKLFVHEAISDIQFRLDHDLYQLVKNKYPHIKISLANDDDWDLEYNDLILAIKMVEGLEGAIKHINTFGSKHTDTIITNDDSKAQYFINQVDSACVFHNCSTRFSDGFVFGLGAEVAISTGKIHARGPVGLQGLVTTKWVLRGQYHLKSDYSQGQKQFLHKKPS